MPSASKKLSRPPLWKGPEVEGGLKTGVYCWTNRINSKVYVGSASASFSLRFRLHRSKLRKGKHENRHFQNAWKKYGSRNFVLSIVERCPPGYCLEREQYWIDKLKAADRRFGYNICPVAGNRRGVRAEIETRRKISQAVSELWKSDEYRIRMKEAHRNQKPSQETRERLSRLMTGRKKSPEAVAKTAAFWRGRKHREDTKEKLRRAAKEQWEKQRAAGYRLSIEVRRRRSEAARKQWADPVVRDRMIRARRRREKRHAAE